jgi:molybdopterin molybdotransferase
MLAALVRRDGGVPADPVMVPDRPEAVRSALLGAPGEVVLITGGTSVGQEDHVPAVLAEAGELLVHGVALRPGGPAGFGALGGSAPKLVFLMPGNPVSCLAAYELFAGRAIRRLGGRPPELPHRRVTLPLGRKVVSASGRVDYLRVQVRGGTVEPLASVGASVLSSTTRADGFVLVPGPVEGYEPGELVGVFLYE